MKATRITSFFHATVCTGIIASAVLVFALPASAQSVTSRIQSGLNAAAAGYGAQPASADQLPAIIGNILNVLISFLGILLLGYLVYGGFLWMTAGGDKGKVDKAVATIRNAVIGLVIIVTANAIAYTVIDRLSTAIAPGA